MLKTSNLSRWRRELNHGRSVSDVFARSWSSEMWHAFRSISRRKAATLAKLVCVALIVGIATSRSWSLSSLPDPTDTHVSLSDIERAVAAIYPVPEILASDVADNLGRREVVLFDVRDRQEFETSHLPGAINIDPDMMAERFLSEHGRDLQGRIVVFYCSVGVRSGSMVKRAMSAIAPYRPAATYNLRGGIFRWFVEGRNIVDAHGPATMIHPYDETWRGLLQRTLDARS
jgi:rhodanese-related sulfurtransferase